MPLRMLAFAEVQLRRLSSICILIGWRRSNLRGAQLGEWLTFAVVRPPPPRLASSPSCPVSGCLFALRGTSMFASSTGVACHASTVHPGNPQTWPSPSHGRRCHHCFHPANRELGGHDSRRQHFGRCPRPCRGWRAPSQAKRLALEFPRERQPPMRRRSRHASRPMATGTAWHPGHTTARSPAPSSVAADPVGDAAGRELRDKVPHVPHRCPRHHHVGFGLDVRVATERGRRSPPPHPRSLTLAAPIATALPVRAST